MINKEIKELILKEISEKGIEFINELNEFVYKNSPFKNNPVSYVRWVDIKEVQSNDYNPNIVASNELKLLAVSIKHDGFTQPIVCIKDKSHYIIVDGFHRYYVNKVYSEINKANNGKVPIVILNKNINDRMASTVRHNRARGKHTVNGMGQLIYKMIGNGWDDVKICNELGLEPDELIRLKNISGVAKLFEGKEYSNAWEESYSIKKRMEKK
ncbi:MAG: ParB/RepB/Spo0J family partition protein [Candidatus Pacearchaeota archaeon]|jgi:hypothetical protein